MSAVYVSHAFANTAPTAGDTAPIYGVSEHLCEYQKTYSWSPRVFDADGDPLVCRILVPPTYGTATVAADCSSGTYRPQCYLITPGRFSFTYVANDGTVDSNPGTVNIELTGNYCSMPAVATVPAISYTATPGSVINWLVPVFSTYFENCKITSQPLYGTFTQDLAQRCAGTYKPNVGFLGQDKISYSYTYYYESNMCRQQRNGDVVITVAETNPAPVAEDVTVTEVYAIYIYWTPKVSDSYGDGLKCRLVTPPKNGQAYVDGSCLRSYYTPASGFIGTDTFTYLSNDGFSDSNVATVTVIVSPPNVIAGDINISVLTDEPVTWIPKVSSVSGNMLYCRIDTPPLNGNATVVGYNCSSGTYQSNPGFVGIDSFSYISYYGLYESFPGTVTVAVTEAQPSDTCLVQYPISQFTNTGKDGSITIRLTGNIVSYTNKVVKACPGTTLKYQTSSTKGPVVCKVKNNTTRDSGSLKINDHIKCTDKPAGKDKIHFKVKSGVK